MNWLDFFIGFTLVNALPHYILGVWRQPMLSGFGVGNRKNIIWGLVNYLISVGLFLYEYGFSGFAEHAMYTGASVIVVTFFITSFFWRNRYSK